MLEHIIFSCPEQTFVVSLLLHINFHQCRLIIKDVYLFTHMYRFKEVVLIGLWFIKKGWCICSSYSVAIV